ncbi:MAG: hypothetical protein HY002_02490 [Candidatus Rokubacteria bacterium]|nr:hypothetical protein [Candidatus Rokubacteria bacterium]
MAPSLKRFFDPLVRRSLDDLWMGGQPVVADYLSSLLARFARTDQLYALRGAAGQRLESIVEMLLEIQLAWAFDEPQFDPFRERDVRQHIGDYTLFMTGIFPEHVERRASTGFYVREGKRAYKVVADFERSALTPGAGLFAVLSAQFEGYATALQYMRRVYLRPADVPSSLQPFVRIIHEW